MARLSEPSPYVEFDRKQWRTLRKSTPLVLTEDELVGLRGLGEQIDLAEVAEVYLPLARLIHLQVAARQRLFAATATFLGEKHPDRQVPFVIGVAVRSPWANPPPRACFKRCWRDGSIIPASIW